MKLPRREMPITQRERDVLNLIAQGMTYQEIAHKFGNAYHTTKQCAHDAFHKIGVRSKTEAAVRVWTKGLPAIGG